AQNKSKPLKHRGTEEAEEENEENKKRIGEKQKPNFEEKREAARECRNLPRRHGGTEKININIFAAKIVLHGETAEKTRRTQRKKREAARENKLLAILLPQRFVLTTFTADLECVVAIEIPRYASGCEKTLTR